MHGFASACGRLIIYLAVVQFNFTTRLHSHPFAFGVIGGLQMNFNGIHLAFDIDFIFAGGYPFIRNATWFF